MSVGIKTTRNLPIRHYSPIMSLLEVQFCPRFKHPRCWL